MKKNMIMKIACVLMLLTLASTSVISGTFAKYVTSDTASAKARVAKFGIVVTASSHEDDPHTLFRTEYETEDTAVDTAKIKYSVKADASVIAPGTSGGTGDDGITHDCGFKISGTAEVAVRVTYGASVKLTGWEIPNPDYGKVEGATKTIEYCPLIISVNGVDYYISKKDDNGNIIIKDIKDLQKAVENAIKAGGKDYAPGTDMDTKNDDDDRTIGDLHISWKWEFDGEIDGSKAGETRPSSTLLGYQTDEKDTLLGQKAADPDTPSNQIPTIELGVGCTVTQID